MADIRYGQYAIYKGLKGTNGAFQFQLNPASLDNGKVKQGCIFIEAAPAIEKNVYDWQNQKVSFALSVSDIQQLLEGGGEVKITHKHNGYTKYFTITEGQSYGYFMRLQATNDASKETTQVSIPLGIGEAIVLKQLLTESIADILGWRGLPLE